MHGFAKYAAVKLCICATFIKNAHVPATCVQSWYAHAMLTSSLVHVLSCSWDCDRWFGGVIL